MKNIEINRQEILKILTLANSINKDANADFLFKGDAENNQIEIISYSKSEILKSIITDNANFKFDSDFSVILPIKKVLNLFNLLEADSLALQLDANKLKVKNNRSTHSISGTDSALYRTTHDELEFTECLIFNRHQFEYALDFIDLSTSKVDSAQLTLKAWNLQINQDFAQFSSCDGHQASLCKLNSNFDLTNKLNVTFPVESIGKIKSFFAKSKVDSVTVFFSNSYIKFVFNDTELFINQNNGNFPDVTKLIFDLPEKTELMLNNSQLLRLIKLVKNAEDAQKSKVLFRLLENELSLELKSSLGEGREILPIEFSKQERKFSLNDKNLMEYLTQYSEKESLFRIMDNEKLPINVLFQQDSLEFILSMFPYRVDE